MAYKTSYELHHHFPRLAEESGFTFNTHRPRVHIDWNKIKLIDLDNLIRERKFVVIEQHLNDILDCVFESEFDVRILDEGVMKMFRLAQLAVEYQQFCRHYLDRSVYVLREEITSLAQELDSSKQQLQQKEEELRKLRKRTRQSFKTPLPYGNDNIAAMILKTLSTKGDIFPSTANEAAQYNICNYCDKAFLNQLYLQSHISRRHGNVTDTPQKEKQANESCNENFKMNAEIMELKTKLKDMEQIIINSNNQNKSVDTESEKKSTNVDENKKLERNVKDAEVSTNNEEYLLDKFEQWKKEEHEKYDKEIKLLRTQILETINAIKDKQIQQPEPKDTNVIEQLHSTLVQQGAELLALKQELSNSKIEANVKEDNSTNKEAEAQIAFWTKRAEVQSKQYDALLQKLNDVAQDAKESRALAEIEREKAAQLQALLQQSLQRRASETVQTSTDDLVVHPKKRDSNTLITKHEKSKQLTNRQTLENLHKKAQELLNIGSISTTSSEASSSSEEKAKPPPRKNRLIENSPNKAVAKVQNTIDHAVSVHTKYNGKIETNAKDNVNSINVKEDAPRTKYVKASKASKPRNDKIKYCTKIVKDPAITISASPIRVVRAKLTEEVNSRLVCFGVDPLKSRLPQSIYQKQRLELQQLNEIKSKKSPSYEKTRYGILAYLDENTEEVGKKINGNNEYYVSHNRVNKHVRSISSVISNVKSKALSLVKLNDNSKEKLRSINTDVTKRAMTLLRTPPDSGHESPMSSGRSPSKNKRENTSNNTKVDRRDKIKHNHETSPELTNGKIITIKKNLGQFKTVDHNETEQDSNESDHEYHSTITTTKPQPTSKTSKSIENLIKSPARRPASADIDSVHAVRKYTIENGDLFVRTQSATNLSDIAAQPSGITSKATINNENSSDEVESLTDTPRNKVQSDENIQRIKQTKGVLKNASSTSSLNKKKVLFDMDAIQMKSVSASPSQSITEKSDGNEKYELGLVNLDGEEWDISSIENEPLKNDTKIQINTRASPKIAELRKTIESQLARRNDTPSTAIVGGVDILAGPIHRVPSAGGSNTSLGSSILDESETIPPVNHKAFVKPRKVAEKDDSELDISEFSIDGITVTNKNESF